MSSPASPSLRPGQRADLRSTPGGRVRDVMSQKIVTISADERLSTVEDIMTLGHVRHMPVVRAGKLVGVVSEREWCPSAICCAHPSRT